MGILQQSNVKHRAPIGRITFHLQTSLFRVNDGKYEKAREFLKIGESKDILDIKEDYIEIQDGYYIKNNEVPQYSMTFGEIIVRGNGVRTCSRNGVIIRKLKIGQKLKVVSLKLVSSDVTVYGINEKEYISSDEDIQYVMGTFEFEADSKVMNNGQTYRYKKGDVLPYQRLDGNNILLLNDTWLDISNLNGCLNGC